MKTYDDVPTLFKVNGVSVKMRRSFWLVVALVWVLLAWIATWRWPGQSILAYVLIGGVAMLMGMAVEVGHACAHTIGARLAHAPMALVLLGTDMPRTLYPDAQVRPGQHIARSLGGPVYSWLGFGIGLLALHLTAPQSAARYLVEIWTFGSAFIGVASLAPLPLVDGGVLLKWLLVIAGQSEEVADRTVCRVDVALAVLLLIAAVMAALLGWWWAAAALVTVAIVFGLIIAGIIH